MSLDDRICAYYQLHGQGQSMVDSTGRIYDKACSNCAFTIRHWKEATVEGQDPWVCGHCGAPWGHEDVEILKGIVSRASRNCKPIQTVRPGEYEDRLAGLAHLGYHLNALLRDEYWIWAAQAMVGHAMTSCDYEDIALHANEYGWPTRRGGEWSESMARNEASRARRELRKRLMQGPEIAPRPEGDVP